MFCPKCGKETPDNQAFCASCGAPLTQAATAGSPAAAAAGISPKSRLATTLLAWFLGWAGGHRFYIGKTGTAVVMLILSIVGFATCWLIIGFIPLTIVWVWQLIDFVFAVVGKMKDKDGLLIEKW
jgi:TM2 domain-containing membrane protein YozV